MVKGVLRKYNQENMSKMRENEFFRHGGLARIFTLSSDPPLDPHSARASRLASVCESIV